MKKFFLHLFFIFLLCMVCAESIYAQAIHVNTPHFRI